MIIDLQKDLAQARVALAECQAELHRTENRRLVTEGFLTSCEAHLKQAESERDEARAALAWYADKAHWQNDYMPPAPYFTDLSAVMRDKGQRARQALGEGI